MQTGLQVDQEPRAQDIHVQERVTVEFQIVVGIWNVECHLQEKCTRAWPVACLARGDLRAERMVWQHMVSKEGAIHTLAPPARIVPGVCRARAVQKSDAVGVGRIAAYARSCELIHLGTCACINSPDHVRRPHPAAPLSVCATNLVRPIAPLVCLEEVRRAALRASSGA